MTRPTEKWACHVCGQLREDKDISVQKNVWKDPVLGKIEENVRYCNDKAECAAAAPKVTFVGRRKGTAIASRQRRAMGE